MCVTQKTHHQKLITVDRWSGIDFRPLSAYDGAIHGRNTKQQNGCPWNVHNRKIINLKRSRIVADSDGDYFLCDDGIRISNSKLNDDYCDCDDGSDEPDTEACSGVSYFECHVRFTKFKIPSGWVNDGICDCCDGSDERDSKSIGLIHLSMGVQKKMNHFLSPCPNTCPK
uniref:Glucosidase II beta subunit N-terminal domain-containing protein n=1 Tax=Lygus hesperus TaxID=30085 RepID=A0A0K8S4S1_LYGHE